MQLEQAPKKGMPMSLTPIIDVVFLLLIFFMLSSTFLHYTSLPLVVKSQAGTSIKPQNIVLLRIDAKGGIEINGTMVKKENVLETLNTLAQKPEAKLVIKPRKGASVQHLVTVMDLAKKSKIKSTTVIK